MVPVNRLPCCRIAYPETKHNSKFKGNQFSSIDNLSTEQKTFVEDTAEKIGVNKRTIYREIDRANKIIEEAKQVIKEKDLPNVMAISNKI